MFCMSFPPTTNAVQTHMNGETQLDFYYSTQFIASIANIISPNVV